MQHAVPRAQRHAGDDRGRRKIGAIGAERRLRIEVIQRADHGPGRSLYMRVNHRHGRRAAIGQAASTSARRAERLPALVIAP